MAYTYFSVTYLELTSFRWLFNKKIYAATSTTLCARAISPRVILPLRLADTTWQKNLTGEITLDFQRGVEISERFFQNLRRRSLLSPLWDLNHSPDSLASPKRAKNILEFPAVASWSSHGRQLVVSHCQHFLPWFRGFGRSHTNAKLSKPIEAGHTFRTLLVPKLFIENWMR